MYIPLSSQSQLVFLSQPNLFLHEEEEGQVQMEGVAQEKMVEGKCFYEVRY